MDLFHPAQNIESSFIKDAEMGMVGNQTPENVLAA